MKQFVYFLFGLFLVLDGIISIIWGMECESCFHCPNNDFVGNIVRVIRTVIGALIMWIPINR